MNTGDLPPEKIHNLGVCILNFENYLSSEDPNLTHLKKFKGVSISFQNLIFLVPLFCDPQLFELTILLVANQN